MSVGVVGLGYWGPNLVRTFDELPQSNLRWLCDLNEETRRVMKARYPHATTTPNFDDLLNDETLDAIVVATPVPSHYKLAKRALEAEKHVFVEKPIALSVAEADRLVALADSLDRRLMVGHVLLFHPAVQELKRIIDAGDLGDIYYLYCNRQNLGKVRRDENALWSLGAHDISVILYLLGDEPIEVSARGESYVQPAVADVVFCYLRFATGIAAHLHLSWLDPHKMRKLTAVGSRRMAVFDDMELERKLTIYEKSVAPQPKAAFGEYVQVRFGDILSPRVAADEPLRIECEHFIAAIRSAGLTMSTGREGAAVVNVLQGLQRSLERNGATEVVGADRQVDAPVVPIPLRA